MVRGDRLTATGSPSTNQWLVLRLRAAGCVFAEDEARLLIDQASTPAELEELTQRRVQGQPLEHILGWAEFAGRRIQVDPGVFVPRRRTEYLARRAIELTPRNAVVLDLCCGSGALAVAVAAATNPAELYASDVDPVAVTCALRNLAPIGGQVFGGDLFGALPGTLCGRVDTLVANAPYVPTDAVPTMPPEARLFEPTVALDGGPDGLATLLRVITSAPEWLAPGGHLLLETSGRQAPLAAEAMRRAGLQPVVDTSDDLAATVVIGAMAAHSG